MNHMNQFGNNQTLEKTLWMSSVTSTEEDNTYIDIAYMTSIIPVDVKQHEIKVGSLATNLSRILIQWIGRLHTKPLGYVVFRVQVITCPVITRNKGAHYR